MSTRKRAAKKAPAKRTNSQISQVQKESAAKQQARIAADQAKRDRGPSPAAPAGKPAAGTPAIDPKLQAAKDAIDPHRKRQPTLEQNTRPGTGNSNDAFKAGTQAAAKIAGLATGLADQHQEQARQQAIQDNIRNPNPLADASNYGSNGAARAQRLTALMNAQNQAKTRQLTTSGKAVYMGARMNRAKIRTSGPERQDENGKDYTIQAVGDDIRSTDDLMSWLSDEKTFNQIRDAAKKSGIDVQSYDDVAKLWQSVVQQAASTYSTTGKKVTPWALMQLRGKNMVNGKPASKTTTSTNIDQMDPAQAKVMIKQSLQQALGRDPRQDEIDDFIAKAQTIAQQNPQVTKTTTQYDFAGSPTDQTSVSHGGTDVVSAKAQLAADQAAENAPDYAQYQAAGVYAPWMFQALASPI